MRRAGAVAAVLAGGLLAATPAAAQDSLQWHGYGQLRYAHADPASGFTLRRAKLWLGGPVPGVEQLSFKVQGIFRGGDGGALVLQDLFADYGGSRAGVRVGQFVPAFSLQRSQPDYRVPLIERAAVVETLIPDARTMGRDRGVEVRLAPDPHASLAAGVFDGSGTSGHPVGAGDFLATARLRFSARLPDGATGAVGGSVAWRRTDGMDVGVLSTEAAAFAGRDLRWGVDAQVAGTDWEVQAEYLHADLEGEESHGFYVLGNLALTDRDALALSVEQLHAPGLGPGAHPWYIAGLTRMLGRDAARPARHDRPIPAKGALPTRLMVDVRCQPERGMVDVAGALQLQVFLH